MSETESHPHPYEVAGSRRKAEQALRGPGGASQGAIDAANGEAECPGALIERLDAAARGAQASTEQLDRRLRLASRMLKCLDEHLAQAASTLPRQSREIGRPEAGQGVASAEAGAAALERAEAVVRSAEDAERNVALMLHRAAELLQEMVYATRDQCARSEKGNDEPAIEGSVLPTDRPAADHEKADPAPGRDHDPGDGTADATPEDHDELMAMYRELQSQLAALQEQYDRVVAVQSIHDQSEDLTTRVLATVSEEIRAPVETIARLVELLAETGLDPMQRDYLTGARTALRSLEELMKSVPGSPEALPGLTEAQVEQLDIHTLVADAADRLALAAERRGLRIRSVVESDEPALWGDSGRLRQALLFALNRAVQCATGAEVLLSADTARQPGRAATIRFRIVGARAGSHACRAGDAPLPAGAADTVSGADSYLAGLGLTISRQLVESLGGTLGVAVLDEERFEVSLTVDLSCDSPDPAQPQAYPRLPQEDLESNLGRVLDLSVNGMRIACARVPPEGEIVDVELADPEGAVLLKAMLVWSRRLGFRRHEAGLRFIEVSPELAADLTRVSLNHRVPTAVAHTHETL